MVCVHVHDYEVHAIICITRFQCIRRSLALFSRRAKYFVRIFVFFAVFRFHSASRKAHTRIGLFGRPFSVLNFVCLRAFIALRCVLYRARVHTLPCRRRLRHDGNGDSDDDDDDSGGGGGNQERDNENNKQKQMYRVRFSRLIQATNVHGTVSWTK